MKIITDGNLNMRASGVSLFITSHVSKEVYQAANYIRIAFPHFAWEPQLRRIVNGGHELVSALFTRKEANKLLDEINEIAYLGNSDERYFSIFQSRLDKEKWRVVADLRQVDLKKLERIALAHFLNEVCVPSDDTFAGWHVSEEGRVSCIGSVYSAFSFTELFPEKISYPININYFNDRDKNKQSETTDLYKAQVYQLVNIDGEILTNSEHDVYALYCWRERSLTLLTCLMKSYYEKHLNQKYDHFTKKVTSAVMASTALLPPEIGYQIGMFLTLRDASRLSLVNKAAAFAAREAKWTCEKAMEDELATPMFKSN